MCRFCNESNDLKNYLILSIYGMSLLSRSAYGWCHIQWTNIEREDMAIRPQPNKNNLETHIQNWQICYQSLQKFQVHHSQDASL